MSHRSHSLAGNMSFTHLIPTFVNAHFRTFVNAFLVLPDLDFYIFEYLNIVLLFMYGTKNILRMLNSFMCCVWHQIEKDVIQHPVTHYPCHRSNRITGYKFS